LMVTRVSSVVADDDAILTVVMPAMKETDGPVRGGCWDEEGGGEGARDGGDGRRKGK